jgi:hypothetical protein
MVCEIWEDESTRHPLTVILRNAVEREDAARLLSRFVERELLGRLPAQTRESKATIWGSLAYSALVGMVVARYVIGVEPLASAPVDMVVQTMGPAIQRYLVGEIAQPDEPTGLLCS